MAYLAPITDVSYDVYFNIIHELTTDLRRVEQYKNNLVNKPGTGRYQLAQFNKILKFSWDKHMETYFSLTLAKETTPREVKILGFMNIGKVLLQDRNSPDWPIIANPDEIIKILKPLDVSEV